MQEPAKERRGFEHRELRWAESPASGSWREKATHNHLPGAELRQELLSLASRF